MNNDFAVINRRNFLHTASLGTVGSSLLASLPAEVQGASKKGKKPNILYITADDLAPKLGCYGHTQVFSTNIDKFAKESLLFERAYCQCALCGPSRVSILTGIRPSTSGIFNWDDWRTIMPKVKSMPEHFKDNGYNTYSIGKIWDPRNGPGTQEGWTKKLHEWGVDNKHNIDILTMMNEAKNSNKPFILFAGYSSPHCPWTPAKKYVDMYPLEKIKLEGPGRRFHNEYLQECSGANKEIVDDNEAKEISRRYFAEVTELDDMFGEVVKEAKKLKLWDDCIIIFWCGDHGYHLGENNLWGKWTNYNASTQVPLLMKIPGMKTAGQKVPRLVETVDMYPTLVDLAGLPKPAHELEGTSFKPLFENPTRKWKKAVFSQYGNGSKSSKTERYNYIKHKNGKIELFDLLADPKETTNIAKNKPDIVKMMDELLTQGWRKAKPTL